MSRNTTMAQTAVGQSLSELKLKLHDTLITPPSQRQAHLETLINATLQRVTLNCLNHYPFLKASTFGQQSIAKASQNLERGISAIALEILEESPGPLSTQRQIEIYSVLTAKINVMLKNMAELDPNYADTMNPHYSDVKNQNLAKVNSAKDINTYYFAKYYATTRPAHRLESHIVRLIALPQHPTSSNVESSSRKRSRESTVHLPSNDQTVQKSLKTLHSPSSPKSI